MTDETTDLLKKSDDGAIVDEVGSSSEEESQPAIQMMEVGEESGQRAAAEEVAVEIHEEERVSSEKEAVTESEAGEKPEQELSRPESTEGTPAAPEGEDGKSKVDYSRTFRSLSVGDVVDGVVVHIDKEGVLVDVGTKSEGMIRPGELSVGHVQSAEDVVSVGDTIHVYVLESESEDGNLLLSKKRADFEKAWERVQEAHDEGRVVTAMVTDRVKGGLVVDLGIRGFVPGSHMSSGKVRNLDRYVGQSVPLKVIEVDRGRRKVVLSHRLALEETRVKQRDEVMGSLVEGQIREGIVRRTTEYGAFVDLGGLDGLLHISEMSWARIKHPSDVVKVGEKIHVMVLRINPEAGRVSLGLRQILPDPWSGLEQKYNVGDVVSGTVSRLVPFGAFVQLDGGIEGIIPNAELTQRRVKRPDDVISVGESVEAKIIEIRAEERRMTLSRRRIHEEKDYETYQSSRSDGGMTLGDLVGEQLQELAAANEAVEAGDEAKQDEDVKKEAKPAKARSRKSASVKAQKTPASETVEDESAEADAGVEAPVEVVAADESAEADAEKAEAEGQKPAKRGRKKKAS